MNFADRLIAAIKQKANPCVVGLDPRIDMMPAFIQRTSLSKNDPIRDAIRSFNTTIIETIRELVPAVKLQVAFYEQYGVSGIQAFKDSIDIAKESGLIVIVDAKRNDIASTAQAYSNAYLRKRKKSSIEAIVFDVDCITVNPYLGADSLRPFVDACAEHGKGLFVLVKTSNPGSKDLQDQYLSSTNAPLYESAAKLVYDAGRHLLGAEGYSSIGAVVGATFPEEARRLRVLLPDSIFLVPGFGAQGGEAADVVPCFNPGGLGAVVNASRSITYAFERGDTSKDAYQRSVDEKTRSMIKEITQALGNH